MTTLLEQLTSTLKAHNYSVTAARKTVFAALAHREPQSMSELIKAVAPAADRASVYRIIALFEKLGIVQRLQIGWKYKLELSDTFASHHHHMTCTICGDITSFEESKILESELKQLAQAAGFLETSHQLEIRGLCPTCR